MPKYRHKIQFFARIPCQKTENSVSPLSLPSLPFSAHSVKLSLHSPPGLKSFCQKRFTKGCLRRNSPFPGIRSSSRPPLSRAYAPPPRPPLSRHMLLSPRSPFSRAYAPPPDRPSPVIYAARPRTTSPSRPSGKSQNLPVWRRPLYILLYSVRKTGAGSRRLPLLTGSFSSPSGGTGAKAFPRGAV